MNQPAISENFSKKKRGRPPKLYMDDWMKMFPKYQTVRGAQNMAYIAIAVDALKKVPGYAERYKWILGDGTGASWRRGILTELGRFEDKDDLRAYADEVCELRLNGRRGTAILHKIRLGRDSRAGNALQLAREIETLINSYLQRNPEKRHAVVADALQFILDEVVELADAEAMKADEEAA